MILQIKLKNILSVKDEITLDLRSANINNKNAKALQNNLFALGKEKVLKTVALYGANASGKSNIIKAINFCCRFILDSHEHDQNKNLTLKPFKFNKSNDLSLFQISFNFAEIKYEYTFEMDLHKNEFVKERLYFYPHGKKLRIFTRDETLGKTKTKKYKFGEQIKQPFDVAENTSNKQLFLSQASLLEREIGKKLNKYFNDQFIISNEEPDSELIKNVLTNEKAKDFVLNSLKIADSDICDIQFVLIKDKYQEIKMMDNSKVERQEREIEVIKIKAFHRQNPNIAFDFYNEESEGTKKLFFVLLNIYDILLHNKTLIIDELETSLHPKLVAYIINLFHKNEKAQLIFSTHNTSLLDLKRFRKDQIYFINKKENGSSDLYSLYDYSDFRETMDLEKAYLHGRFDAIPFIQE